MNHSDAINELAAALAKAQGAMGNAPFNKTNPHFKSKYADLASVRDTVTPHLAANGLSLVQTTMPGNGSMTVVTSLLHSSGQWLSSEYPIINDVMKPQAMGSALTYARRYSISCICGIASEEDDDANAANDHGKTAPPAPPAPMQAAGGTPGASKAANRAIYDALSKAIANATGVATLKQIYEGSIAAIEAMPPDWVDELRVEYSDRLSELKLKAAA